MSELLSKLGNTLLSTKLDFLYGYLSGMDDTGISRLVDIIKSKIGIDIANADVLNNLNEDTISQIRQCVFDNFSDISDLYVKYKKIVTDDTKNARDMYLKSMEDHKDNKFMMYFPPIFGGFICLSIVIYMYLITFISIPQNNQRFADTSLGILMGIFATIVAFYFGSSDTFGRTVLSGKKLTNNASTKTVTTDASKVDDITAKCEITTTTDENDIRLPKE